MSCSTGAEHFARLEHAVVVAAGEFEEDACVDERADIAVAACEGVQRFELVMRCCHANGRVDLRLHVDPPFPGVAALVEFGAAGGAQTRLRSSPVLSVDDPRPIPGCSHLHDG